MRSGHSLAKDPRRAVDELYDAIVQPRMALVVFFCSSHFDLVELAQAINHRFSHTLVIGCTSAGEIGPAGYLADTLVGASFSSSHCTAKSVVIDDLPNLDEARARHAVAPLHRSVDGRHQRSFAFLLTDGMCGCEEKVTNLLQRALGDIALVGGSAGDDQQFASTLVFADGVFRSQRAVLTTVTTSLPFTVFRSSHFVAKSEPLVVTEADPARRLVYEINGRPAVVEYARALGTEPARLQAGQFAQSPMVVRLNGNDYVRSIQHANPDGSLTLYCAIERGVVLRIAEGADMIANRKQLFADIRQHIGEPQFTLGFDCIHCRLEAERTDITAAIGQMFEENRVLGFSTYGEQFLGVHVNQTLTGIAIGRGSAT